MKKRILSLVLASVLALGMTACGSTTQTTTAAATTAATQASTTGANTETTPAAPAEEKETTITIAIKSGWGGWDPTTATTQYNCTVNDLIYDRLATPHDDGSYTERLCTSWESTNDYYSIIFHINENAKWHDGEPVTANDIIWTIGYWTNPNGNTKMAGYFKNVVGTDASGYQVEGETLGLTAIDDHTLQMDLKIAKRATAVLDEMNRYFWVLPEHIFGQYTAEQLKDASIWNSNIIGSGPYKYVADIADNQLETTKNENYHLGCPDIDNINVKVVDASTMIAGMQSGEIDVIPGGGSSISTTDWAAAQQVAGYTCVNLTTESFSTMFFNEDCEKLSDVRVRTAINYAIDRQGIVNSMLGGMGTPSYFVFSPQHPYFDDSLNWPTYDPQKAMDLLAEAGWDSETELHILCSSGSEKVPQLIQVMLQAVGIKVVIDTDEFNTVLSSLRKGEFEMGMMGASGNSTPYTQYYWVFPGHANNFSNMKDMSISDLITEAMGTMDVAKEHELWSQIEAKVIEEMPFAVLYTSDYLCTYNSHIQNIATDSWTMASLGTVWEWTWVD